MNIYTEEHDGPTMSVELPVTVVADLMKVLFRYATPAMGTPMELLDELRAQYHQQTGQMAEL